MHINNLNGATMNAKWIIFVFCFVVAANTNATENLTELDVSSMNLSQIRDAVKSIREELEIQKKQAEIFKQLEQTLQQQIHEITLKVMNHPLDRAPSNATENNTDVQ